MENKMCGMSRWMKFSAEFLTNEGGNAAMIFGLSLMPLVLMLGVATDYSRYTVTRAALQQATDATALMLASKMGAITTGADLKSQAQAALNAHTRMSAATVNTAEISADKQTICITTQVVSQNIFMRVAQIAPLTPIAKSCANLESGVSPDQTYEIALVLDNSGSMSSSAGGVSKMQALRNAATSFVDMMYSKSTNVKMSIVPFAANVVVLDPTDNSNRNKAWIDKQGDNSQHWVCL
ncbi:MAG: pilus assembly protein TadG-related protein, partial [Methylocystis sp.]|nr:pilus assembly protein TadG-related protein [Methylocystis sp.]